LNPKQEIKTHLKKLQRKLSNNYNEYDDICREINELNFEDAHLAMHFKKLKSRDDVCQQLLEEPLRCSNAESNRQLKIELKKLKQKKIEIQTRHTEIHRQKEERECDAANVLDRFHELESIIELWQTALEGEDVPIWAEIQRFESKQREKPTREKY